MFVPPPSLPSSLVTLQIQQNPEYQEHNEEGRHQLSDLQTGPRQEVPPVHRYLSGDRKAAAPAFQGLAGVERSGGREEEQLVSQVNSTPLWT